MISDQEVTPVISLNPKVLDVLRDLPRRLPVSVAALHLDDDPLVASTTA